MTGAARRLPPITHVLLDLDGTLLDTGPDLARALNAVREAHGMAPLPYADIRPHVSHGSHALTRLGFDFVEGSAEYETCRQALLDTYAGAVAVETRFFPGMATVLDELEQAGMGWGIVTNKPGYLTAPLLDAMGLASRAGSVVAGDTLAQRKPDPAPLLHAARELDADPGSCVYVGDAERDVEAGRRAGMRTAIALYGYLGPDDHPEQWRADAVLVRASELLDVIEAWRGA